VWVGWNGRCLGRISFAIARDERAKRSTRSGTGHHPNGSAPGDKRATHGGRNALGFDEGSRGAARAEARGGARRAVGWPRRHDGRRCVTTRLRWEAPMLASQSARSSNEVGSAALMWRFSDGFGPLPQLIRLADNTARHHR